MNEIQIQKMKALGPAGDYVSLRKCLVTNGFSGIIFPSIFCPYDTDGNRIKDVGIPPKTFGINTGGFEWNACSNGSRGARGHPNKGK